MKTMSLDITHETTTQSLDMFFTDAFKRKGTFKLVLNVIGCPRGMYHVQELQSVIEKHRESTRRLLVSTKITTDSYIVATLIRATLALLRPEKPVVVCVVNGTGDP